MQTAKTSRFVELDLLRTLAIFLMILYHLAYDLEEFYGWPLGIFEHPGWIAFRVSVAALFLLLVGISFSISWSRTPLYKKYLKRGLGVIACGMLVSAVTYGFEPETYVRFGILHLIGVSILLLPFFARFKEWNALLGLGFGSGLGFGTAKTSLLIPLGIPPQNFMSVDYFPLIPWFGIVLIGYAIGLQVYAKRQPALLLTTHYSLLTRMAWPGRHALLIYLLHQPLLLGALGAFGALGVLQ